MSSNVMSPYPWQVDQFDQVAELYGVGRLPHALLIQGEPGLGKLVFAQAFAQLILCQNSTSLACGQCKGCQLFQAGTHPDLMQVHLEEKAKQIKVDQIRTLVDFVGKTSQLEGMQVIIIEPAEAMNINAANALLKSLEEPTPNTLILLVTDAPQRLLPTIRSRCQSLSIVQPSEEESLSWLSTFVADQAMAAKLLQLAKGNPLSAKRLYESEFIDDYHSIAQFFKEAGQGQANPIQKAEVLSKLDPKQVIDVLQSLLWDLIKASKGWSLEKSVAFEQLMHFDTKVDQQDFDKKAYAMLDEIQQAQQDVLGNSNPNIQLLMESLLIRLQALLRI